MAAEVPPRPVRLIAADDLGLLKVVEAPSITQLGAIRVVNTWCEPNREELAVSSMCVSSGHEGLEAAGSLVAVARVSGPVEVRNSGTGVVEGTIPAVRWFEGGQGSRVVSGLSFLPGSQSISPAGLQAVLSCTVTGMMRIHRDPSWTGLPAWALAACPPGCWREAATWTVPTEVSAMAVDEAGAHVAIGCRGTSHLTVWDLATRERVFLAKGSKPNAIGLVDKPWDSATAYLPGGDGVRVVVGTGHHKLRVFDVRAQRRPVMEVGFGEARVTAVAPERDGHRVWAANATGDIRALDLRTHTLQESLRGPAGSVRSLALHPSEPYLASVGLDRFLRVHHTGTRTLAAKVYLKQCLTAVGFCAATPGAEAAEPATAEAGVADAAEVGDNAVGAVIGGEEEAEDEEEEDEEIGRGKDAVNIDVLMVDEDGGGEAGGGDDGGDGSAPVVKQKKKRRKSDGSEAGKSPGQGVQGKKQKKQKSKR